MGRWYLCVYGGGDLDRHWGLPITRLTCAAVTHYLDMLESCKGQCLGPRASNLHLHLLLFLGRTLSVPSFTRSSLWAILCLYSLRPTFSISDGLHIPGPSSQTLLGLLCPLILPGLRQWGTPVGNGKQDQRGKVRSVAAWSGSVQMSEHC